MQRENSDFTTEKPGIYNLKQVIKFTFTDDKGYCIPCLQQDAMKAFHLYGILPQGSEPHVIMRKHQLCPNYGISNQ